MSKSSRKRRNRQKFRRIINNKAEANEWIGLHIGNLEKIFKKKDLEALEICCGRINNLVKMF